VVEELSCRVLKLKMREHKLQSDVKWQGVLKQKGVKQMGIKQRLDVQTL
jgi:hypothetical protein